MADIVPGLQATGLTAPDKFLTLLAMPTEPQGDAVQGYVPSAYVRLLFDYLEQQGVAAGKLLHEKPPVAGDRGRQRYPVQRWRDLLERAAGHLRDPLLGLHLGRRITPAHLGVMGYVLLNCGRLGAALERFEQFQRLIYDVNPLRRRLEGSSLLLEWGVERGRPGPLVDETALSALVQFVRELTGRPELAVEEVWFVNPMPADPKPFRDYFGGEVRFSQPTTRLRFAARHLALPLRAPDADLLAMLESQAQALLAELPEEKDFRMEVRRSIARLTRAGDPTLESVAAELHLSTRTLHRRLGHLDCNFRQLLEETRRQLADSYLNDPRLQLAEIAQLLGFSEQSAFNRAYRRWTGSPPGATRKRAARRR